MRLDEHYRQSTVLIGNGSPDAVDKINPWGTGFLAWDRESGIYYLITAAHVIADKSDAPFQVRFNKSGGGAENHTIDPPDWVMHPTDITVDVAVHEIEVPTWAECSVVPIYPNILLEDRMESKDIGAGNRTYTVGLWRFLRGDHRNQPFVYTGHIGLIPEDQRIPVKPWLPQHKGLPVLVEAYLIEGEPLDGASGSPVFVRRSIKTTIVPLKGKPAKGVAEGSIWLLGILSDVFTAKPNEDYVLPPGSVIPRGVNVVVPSMKVVEVLDHPKLKAARRAKIAAEVAAALPQKAATKAEPESDNPVGKEDFRSLLTLAAKTPAQDD